MASMASMPLPSSPRSCSTATPSDSLQNSVASLSHENRPTSDAALADRTRHLEGKDNESGLNSQKDFSGKSGNGINYKDNDSTLQSADTGVPEPSGSLGPQKAALKPPSSADKAPWSDKHRNVSFHHEVNMPREGRRSSYSGRDSLGRGPSPDVSPAALKRRAEEVEADRESSADEHTAIFKGNGSNARSGYGATAGGPGDAIAPPGQDAYDDTHTNLDPMPAGFFSPRRRSSGTFRRKSIQNGPLNRGSGRAPAPQPEQEEDAETENWFRRILDKYGSVELENKGSVARDHLALERTFLAWLRTSLSFASIGIAITQLFRLNTTLEENPDSDRTRKLIVELDVDKHMARHLETLRHIGKPLGATFIGVSILVLLIGFHRYFESQHYVIRGKFPASRGSVALVSMVTGSLIITSLVIVVTVARQAGET